jgi:hypothetical protein
MIVMLRTDSSASKFVMVMHVRELTVVPIK